MAPPPKSRFSTESSLKGPRPMEILDEAASLLRSTPIPILFVYYVGALPFCLALIYFWFDMTQGAEAEAHLPGEALALTALFIWMKTCQAVFARKLLARLEGDDLEEWTALRWMNTTLLQAVYAGSFLVVYPVALVITIPFGWISAFYHNISIVATGAKSTLRSSYREAAELARLWPKQNHLIMGILLVAIFVLFSNLAVFFIMVPQMLNMLFGIETIFDENTYAWNNSSFYLDVSVFCFLILNPLNKAVYALRCFYGRARQNGADLKSALRRLHVVRSQSSPARAFALIVVICLLVSGGHARADEKPQTMPAPAFAPADPSVIKLDQAIQKTLQKDEFAWRMPRAARTDDGQGWLERALNAVKNFFTFYLKKISKLVQKIMDWLFKGDRKHDYTNSSWMNFGALPWRLIFICFAVGIGLILAFFLARYLRNRVPQALTSLTATAVRTVDLEAEDVRADDLPEDSWLALAQQMIERGELRLALRAFYLATLSVLAQQQLVRLGAAKSNRDYLLELTRRLRGNLAVLHHFRENIGLFEASWYGTHDVTAAIIETMRANQQQVRTHAAP